ncbi:MAG: hypothetical protein V2I32_03840, partial [Desulforhopalus sp.]|nr:hypothetical protein [Desulforhopalus sp.]
PHREVGGCFRLNLNNAEEMASGTVILWIIRLVGGPLAIAQAIRVHFRETGSRITLLQGGDPGHKTLGKVARKELLKYSP